MFGTHYSTTHLIKIKKYYIQITDQIKKHILIEESNSVCACPYIQISDREENKVALF